MQKVVVTSGEPFIDIDAIACSIAYCELLQEEGKNSTVVHTSVLNSSITQSVKNLGLDFENTFTPGDYKYVMVDVSDRNHFEKFVQLDKVIEVYDHRLESDKYSYDRLQQNSHIELLGACATLIFEEFVKRSKPLNITKKSAALLQTAIISNTLNFNASITTNRDKKAYHALNEYSSIPNNWNKTYFEEQNKEKLDDVYRSVVEDTKYAPDYTIGQLEMWDSKEIIYEHKDEIQKAMESFGNPEWFMTSPSISEGFNYIFTKSNKVKKLLDKLIDAKFDHDIGITKKLWLRKEIRKLIEDSK